MSRGPDPEPEPAAAPSRAPVTAETVAGAAAMAALLLITLANVVVRYATSASLAFTEELSVALMVVVTLLGAAAAVRGQGHIRITFLVERMGRRWRLAATRAADLATLAMLGLLVWLGARLAYDEWRFEETTPGLDAPRWIYTATLPALATLVWARVAAAAVRRARSGE